MENITEVFANFWGGGLMLVIGLILRFVEGTEGMIAGYNTMGKAEQAKWNVNKLRVFMGRTLISASCVLIIGGILAMFNIYTDFAITVSWGLFFVLILSSVIYLNVSSKFKA